MGLLVSVIIIGGAIASVVAVMWAVMQEKHTHEEWYIPPESTDATSSHDA
jgi:hypothetical protein